MERYVGFWILSHSLIFVYYDHNDKTLKNIVFSGSTNVGDMGALQGENLTKWIDDSGKSAIRIPNDVTEGIISFIEETYGQ